LPIGRQLRSAMSTAVSGARQLSHPALTLSHPVVGFHVACVHSILLPSATMPTSPANVAEASDKIGASTDSLSCREDYGTDGDDSTSTRLRCALVFTGSNAVCRHARRLLLASYEGEARPR
jgi:hypothetical protein